MCSERRGELPHRIAAQEGPCLARCIAPERQRVWGETGELGLLVSVPGVDWTADTRATSQTPRPGASTCFLAAVVTGLAESTRTFVWRLSPARRGLGFSVSSPHRQPLLWLCETRGYFSTRLPLTASFWASRALKHTIIKQHEMNI